LPLLKFQPSYKFMGKKCGANS